jgi:leucyl-tRNA synthetase
VQNLAFSGSGVMVNSGEFDGLSSDEGKERVIATLEERGIGTRATNFRMRDWLVSRQRYWGADSHRVLESCGSCRFRRLTFRATAAVG